MSKAWVGYWDGSAYPVHASSRGVARSTAADQLDCGFVQVEIRRASEFDDVPFDRVRLLKLGYYDWLECDVCGDFIYPEADRDGEESWLCQECTVLHQAGKVTT